MISLDKLKDIVMNASELMVTEGFDISSKEGYSNIVTSSDIAVQDYLCKHLAEAHCQAADSYARKRTCMTRAMNTHG